MARVALVVPCYNEARRLDQAAFAAFRLVEHEIEILFVNDGSRDGTAEMLDGLAQAHAHIRCLHLAKNQGKAEAVRSGVYSLVAGGGAQPDFVGYWDADLATPLIELERFCACLVERTAIDVVMGARVKMLGRRIDRQTYRHIYGRAFATVVSQILTLPVYDTQCGAKLLRVTEDVAPVFAEPFLSRWVFDVELLARYVERWEAAGREASEHIYEIPLAAWFDVAGSKVTVKDAAVAAVDLLRIRERHRDALKARTKRLV